MPTAFNRLAESAIDSAMESISVIHILLLSCPERTPLRITSSDHILASGGIRGPNAVKSPVSRVNFNGLDFVQRTSAVSATFRWSGKVVAPTKRECVSDNEGCHSHCFRTVLSDVLATERRSTMLSMAVCAQRPGLVVDLLYRWRREKYSTVGDWNTPSEALVSALSMNERR
jgi:hypothetical protein